MHARNYFMQLFAWSIVCGLLVSLCWSRPVSLHAEDDTGTVLETLSTGDDFATRVLGDPWDMSGPVDIAIEYTRDRGNVRELNFSDGLLKAIGVKNDPRITLSLPSDANVNPVFHEGGLTPIDADSYRYLTARFYVESDQGGNAAQVMWQARSGEPYGASALQYIQKGWNIVTFDLRQPGIGSVGTWGGSIEGLYFDPTVTNGPFSIDFVRLSRQLVTVPITWNEKTNISFMDIYVGTAADGSDKALLARGVPGTLGKYEWQTSLAAGTYYIFLQEYGRNGFFEPHSDNEVFQTLTLPVNTAPILDITAPSYTSGPDYAAEQLDNAWDMSDGNDVKATHGVAPGFSFAGGMFNGTSTLQNEMCDGVICGDTQVTLPVGPPIDTNRYKYFTYRMHLEGDLDTDLGSVARVLWWSTRPEEATTSKSWVVYEGWQTVSLDLSTLRLESQDSSTWGSSRPIVLRFDPHEFAESRHFHIDYVALTGDEEASDSYMIRYQVTDPDETQATVRFFYDTDAQGFDGQEIQCHVNSQQNAPVPTGAFAIYLPLLDRTQPRPVGVDGLQCEWQTATLPAGTYYVYGVADDGVDTFATYADVPVVVRR